MHSSFLVFCIVISFLDLVVGLRDSERDIGIDVIDGDNLCKGASFLLQCNLLHLLHDAWLDFLLMVTNY